MPRLNRRRLTPSVTFLEDRALLAPVIQPIPDVSAEENETLSIQVQATDAGPIVYSLGAGTPTGMTIDSSSGLVKWTPPFVSQSVFPTIIATAADGTAMTNVRVSVFDVPPNVIGEVNSTIVIGQPFSGNGSFASPDGGSFVASADYGDNSGSTPLTLIGDTFDLSHQYTAPGHYVVSVTVRDEQGYAGFGYFSVDVLPIVTSAPPAVTPTAPVVTSQPPAVSTPTPVVTPAQPIAPTPIAVLVPPSILTGPGHAVKKPKHVVVPVHHKAVKVHKPNPVHFTLKPHKFK